MLSSTVQDVFSEGFESVHEEDTLSSCFLHFKKGMPPVLVVLDNEGKYKGVIARRWIIRSKSDPVTRKVKTLTRSAPTVTLNDSLSRTAKLMVTSEIRQLPVYSGEKLLGFVTDEDVINGAVMQKWGKTHVEEIMTKKPFVLEEKESLGAVLSLFREEGISHVPIVRDGKLVGIVSIHDFIEHIFQPKQRQTVGEQVGSKVPVLSIPAKSIMIKPVVTVLPENTLRLAVKRMHRFDISSLVVVRKGRPVGVLTKRDFLEPIAQMEKPIRKLTVHFSVKDVEIDEIQKGLVMDDFKSFANRYKKALEAGTLFIYMKIHGPNYGGEQLIHCRLRLRTRADSFFSSSEGWGVEQTFRIALDRLERQLLKSTEIEHDSEFDRSYLRRIQFPFTEL